jgi:cytochrome P450
MADPPTFPFPPPAPWEPPPRLAELRARQLLTTVALPSGDTAWLATRHADVRQVCTDRRFSRAAAKAPGAPKFGRSAPQADDSIIFMDPPEHTRLRRLIAPAFSAQRMRSLAVRVQEQVDDLLDVMAKEGPIADFVSGLAQPLPIRAICFLLGVPYEDQEQFRAWGEAAITISPEGVDGVRRARASLEEYLRGLLEERRHRPAEDVLGTLVAARDGDDRLTEAEMLDLGISLLLAGYETSARQLSLSVLTLLRHPVQLSRLRADPAGLMSVAVEELLRHVPLTAVNFMRVATEDVEVGGTLVRAGEGVIPSIVAANRDPGVFAEPDALDVGRASNPHVAFGHGVHYCIGAPLARLELQIALTRLLERFPGLRLAVEEHEIPWRADLAMATLVELPVAW